MAGSEDKSKTFLLIRVMIRAFYFLVHAFVSTKRRIVFLSRQSDEPCLDFVLLRDNLINRMPDWEIVESCHKKQSVKTVVRDVFYVATSRVCILDGYSPAVSIPKVDPKLVVIQLWHAFGAIKKFGWQTVGTKSGRSTTMAEGFAMHKNYTAIIASGTGCVSAYTEAFRCSEDLIKVLGLPTVDYLASVGENSERLKRHEVIIGENPILASGKINVLYAPTFRSDEEAYIGGGDVELFAERLAEVLPGEKCNLIVNTHPFERKTPQGPLGDSSLLFIPDTSSIDLLELAEYVVTDYSSIAFEAASLGKKVIFYVPDIESYREVPGLNIDPEALFPEVTFRHAEGVSAFLLGDGEGGEVGGAPGAFANSFSSFCNSYLIGKQQDATRRIGSYIESCLTGNRA
ncbi:MAG TPA: hypothetical protein DEB24_02785 [Coriobacteriia bacterium]|nr:hypothetical protein [Coriobacteriia bacterium]